jgi:RNA polymerase sigma factor (sigma-70 family)
MANPTTASLKQYRLRLRRRTLERLSPEEVRLLRQLRREPLDFVENQAFHRRGVEGELMSPAIRDGDRPLQRFIQAAADPIGEPEELEVPTGEVLSADQEKNLFLQYNYARYRCVRLAKRTVGRVAGLKEIRAMLGWFAKLLVLRDQIVNANMPLVLAMAKRTRLSNVDFSELISEGNMALLRAIEKFDVARGFKFSTYACRAILKAFSRASMKQSRYRQRFPAEFDPEMERSDYMENRRERVEADCVEQLRDIILKNAADLNEVEQVVIRERFAVCDGPETAHPKTLEEVGQLIGVTKERVRQIQNKALIKLKEALEMEILVA